MTTDERQELTVLLFLILSKESQRNKYQLIEALKNLGRTNYTTSHINSVLYSNKNIFYRSEDTLPLWSAYELEIEEETRPIASISDLCDLTYYRGHPPRTWQIESLEKWIKQGRRGVVEAVTGTGKTTLGILAAADAVARGLDVLVIVPGTDLMDQWYKNMKNCLPELAIGKFGDGFKESFISCNIILATVQSAYRNSFQLERDSGFLIADEVHRYGAEEFSKALKPEFEERLGLTATYDRNDNGLDELLSPYFTPVGKKVKPGKEVIEGCGYARGKDDGILAPFRVALLGVELENEEQLEYDNNDVILYNLKRKLIHTYGCPAEPFGEFMLRVAILSRGNYKTDQSARDAIKYLIKFNERRELLANCINKLNAVRVLSLIVSQSNRCLIFAETIDGASNAANILASEGIEAHAFTSELKKDIRRSLLQEFREGDIQVLAAPKLLDEGIDIPNADLGIILSASHSKRQMIQRMGRIIRPKEDLRPATFIIVYASNTNEDPESGKHEDFLNEMNEHAEAIFTGGVDWTVEDLIEWMNTNI